MPQFLIVDKTRGCSQIAMGAGLGKLMDVDKDVKDSLPGKVLVDLQGVPYNVAAWCGIHPA